MFYFGPLDLDPTARGCSGRSNRRWPAGVGHRRSGAMAGATKLAGVVRFRDSVYQKPSREHGKMEKLTADSLGYFVGAEEQGKELVTRGVLLPLGEIQNITKKRS